MTYYGDEMFPALSDEQWARLQAYGSAQEVESGALLWGAGEATYDLILVDSGEAEVARAATARAAEAVVARFGTGQFAGELSLLTGQATYLSARGRCCVDRSRMAGSCWPSGASPWITSPSTAGCSGSPRSSSRPPGPAGTLPVTGGSSMRPM